MGFGGTTHTGLEEPQSLDREREAGPVAQMEEFYTPSPLSALSHRSAEDRDLALKDLANWWLSLFPSSPFAEDRKLWNLCAVSQQWPSHFSLLALTASASCLALWCRTHVSSSSGPLGSAPDRHPSPRQLGVLMAAIPSFPPPRPGESGDASLAFRVLQTGCIRSQL